jgi:hypothetical protein
MKFKFILIIIIRERRRKNTIRTNNITRNHKQKYFKTVLINIKLVNINDNRKQFFVYYSY